MNQTPVRTDIHLETAAQKGYSAGDTGTGSHQPGSLQNVLCQLTVFVTAFTLLRSFSFIVALLLYSCFAVLFMLHRFVLSALNKMNYKGCNQKSQQIPLKCLIEISFKMDYVLLRFIVKVSLRICKKRV
ncbi:MAG: hypothetical protein LIO75_05790 [Lachnospiraceae bacterium]|nr:hypothetical protein [Lachnospiraceae bacterium]